MKDTIFTVIHYLDIHRHQGGGLIYRLIKSHIRTTCLCLVGGYDEFH